MKSDLPLDNATQAAQLAYDAIRAAHIDACKDNRNLLELSLVGLLADSYTLYLRIDAIARAEKRDNP